VSVVLDGENAWEHFPGGGRPFLRALYAALAGAGDIRTVTMAEAAAAAPSTPLTSIHAGSWINADFYIWIGHRDDHRAWSQLAEARDMFDRHGASASPDLRDRAFEELLIAEGSDWFWWYGDDHSSDHDLEFDELFRVHLRNAYAALGVPVPDELYASNISTGPSAAELVPSGLLSVRLDGRASSFLEWVGAARPSLIRTAGAMHEVAPPSLLTDLLVGFDSRTALCLRLTGPVAGLIVAGTANLVLLISTPGIRQVPIQSSWLAVDELVEVIVSIEELAAVPSQRLEFQLQIRAAGDAVLETLPASGSWTGIVPSAGSGSSDWHL
jgi:hypothetical protein